MQISFSDLHDAGKHPHPENIEPWETMFVAEPVSARQGSPFTSAPGITASAPRQVSSRFRGPAKTPSVHNGGNTQRRRWR